MMSTGPDFFLDLLCLTVYSDTDTTKKIVTQALKVYKEELGQNAILHDKVIRLYVSIVEEILNSQISPSNKSELNALMLKFEHDATIQKYDGLMDKIKSLIDASAEINPKRIEFLQRKIRNWILWHHSNAKIRKLFGKNQECATKTDPMEQDLILNDLLEYARELVRIHEGVAGIANDTIDVINMGDTESIKDALMMNYDNATNNIFKFGLQGFNRMFGVSKGPLRGEFCGVAACSHHYKSGLLMSVARWIATLNKPKVAFGKKAAITFFSLENEIYKNLNMWFHDLYVNMFQQEPDGLSIDDIVTYLYQEFNKNGVTLFVYRKDSDYFGFPEFQAAHTKLEEEGYEVVASVIDYLTLMKLEDGPDNQAKKIQKLAGRLKTFANHKNVLVFTGIQLSGEAEKVADVNSTYIVKRFMVHHLSDCKGLIKEFDWFAFQHIEKNHNDANYLTWSWKKHRYNNPPPVNDRFCGYRFGMYGIMDDIHGTDKSVTDLYTDSAQDGAKEDMPKPQISLF